MVSTLPIEGERGGGLYKEAMQQLEDISRSISSGELDVDQLADKLKQAKELVEFCKQKLQTVEADVNQILGEENA
ncbi:MAG: exodeoxyribonuclease VII small subunit [Bacteroidaceae bacterium]|nr:exodeoxyribonuclease VII small subunit [Bacteroidaceae bacterium]